MKSILALVLMALLVVASFAMTTGVSAAPGLCPGDQDPANEKVETDDGSIVLPAGLTVCIKGSNDNTGIIVTDGVSTLNEYLIAAGIEHNVSHYIIYPTPTPPPPTPSPTPSPPPTPTPTLPPVASQFSVTPAACRFDGDDTRLRIRVIAGLILLSQVDIYIDGNLIDRNDIDIIDGEAFIVVEPGLRAWTITEEDNPEAVLAEGETLCPTCFNTIEPTPTPTAPPPPVPKPTPTATLPPTDTD